MTLSVLCATTSNVNGNPPTGEKTIDGVTTSASLVLLKNQGQPRENGVYLTSSGSWARATDMNAWTKVLGAMVVVQKGTVNAGTLWLSAAPSGGTLDTTAIPFAQAPHTFTPEEFGAVGDGSTDDHAALDAMCRTIELLGKGTALFKGRYAISDTLILPAVPFSFQGIAKGKDTSGPGSIICTSGTASILDFDWNDPDAGNDCELLELNLGYSLGGSAPTAGIGLNMKFSRSARINMSLNNCFNGVYAGVCRDSEISLSGRNFAPREGDMGYALKFDSSIADASHAKGTNVWVPRLFIDGGAGDGDEPGVAEPLPNFCCLDMLGASTVNLGNCQLSSAEIGWRMRMVETDVDVDESGAATYPKGSLQCSGITMEAMSSEGCEHPLDWGGFDKVHVLKIQCNATFNQCTIGDNRSNYDLMPPVELTHTATTTSTNRKVTDDFTKGSIVLNNKSALAPTVHFKKGNSSVTASLSDTALPPNNTAAVSLSGGDTHVAMIVPPGTPNTAEVSIVGNLPPADAYGGPAVFGDCTIVNAHQDAIVVRSGSVIIENLQVRGVGSDEADQYDGVRWEGGTLQILGGRSGGGGNGELTGFDSAYGINLSGSDQYTIDQIDIRGVDVRGNRRPMGINTNVTDAKAMIRDMVGAPAGVFYSNVPGMLPTNSVANVTDTGGVTLAISTGKFAVSSSKNTAVVWRSGPTGTGNFSDTLDTATNIVNALSAPTGYRFRVSFVNTSTAEQRVNAGTGITISAFGSYISVPANSQKDAIFQVTSSTTITAFP